MNDPRDRLLNDDELLLSQCEVRQQRRSGPGGQHRNKVETGILLTHVPSGITVSATERRSQLANRVNALQRLRLQLARQLRSPAAAPSALWRSRCQHQRINVSHRHRHYALVLAEALDHLAAANWRPAIASHRLGCTASSLTRLVRRDSQAWQYLNDQREGQQLPRLR